MSTEPDKAQRWLCDIIENIDRVTGYVADTTLEQFVANPMMVDAVERCMMRITEAAIRLKGDASEWMPEQDWKAMRGFGNLLRHEYEAVQLNIIWQIIDKDFPSLRFDCERTIARFKAGEL